MHTLPPTWFLDLTSEELDLYTNLVPDHSTGTVKSEILTSAEYEISNMELSDIVALFRSNEMEYYTEYWIFEGENGTIIHLEGSIPLATDQERNLYDSIMEKVRQRHREVLEEDIKHHKAEIIRLEGILEEYVW